MTFDEYQNKAHSTSMDTDIGGCRLTYPVLKLAGEAGEVAEKLGKIHRDSQGVVTGVARYELSKELGDVLWYIAEICTQLDLPLESVAKTNLLKLADRQRRGVIGGSGDDR